MDGRKLIAFCVILAGLFFLSSAYAWGPMSLGGMGGAAGTAGGAAGSDLDADFVLDTIGTNSYDFVSANDHYISIPDDDAWTSVKSASMWLTTDTLSFNARLLSRDNSSDVREWLFYFAGDDLRLIFFDEEGDTLGVTKDNVLEGQMWFNATFTWDGTTADSTGMKLYINGKDLGAVDQSSGTFGTVPNTALDLYIGHDNSVTYGHDGKIARTFLTSDVLTAEEIRSTMFAADCTAVAALIDNELECWDFSADTNADWNSNNGTAQPTGGTPVALAATPDYPGLTTSKYWIIEGQILDSEGSGVTVGSLTGYDNISPKLWITASELTITGNSSGDARGAVGPAVTRELGKTYFVDVETSVASFGYFGLDDTSSLDFSGEHMMRTDNSPVVLDYYSEATLHTGITPYVAAELAQYAFVIGGYDDGGVGIPWDNSEAAASYEYGVSVFQKGASIGNKWKLIWKDYVGSSASLYPQVQWVSSGAIGKIDSRLRGQVR